VVPGTGLELISFLYLFICLCVGVSSHNFVYLFFKFELNKTLLKIFEKSNLCI